MAGTSDVKIACASKVITTSDVASDVDITFPSGFGTPKACLLFANYSASINRSTFPDHWAQGFGLVVDDGYETALWTTAKDGVTTSECGHAHREEDDIVLVSLDPGANSQYAKFSRASGGFFGTDKVTIAVDALDADMVVVAMAFGGADCVTSHCSGTVPGATPGNTADYVHNLNTTNGGTVGQNYLIFGVNDEGAAGSYTSGNRSIFCFTMGVVKSGGSTFDYACSGTGIDHNYSSGCRMAYGITNKADSDTLFVSIPSTSASTWKTDTFSMTSPTDDQFTLTRVAGSDTAIDLRFIVIDVGDLDAAILEMDSIATDAADYEVTGAGFTPQAALSLLGKANAYGTNYVSSGNPNIFSLGVASGNAVTNGIMDTSTVTEFGVGSMGDDGNTTTDHICWTSDRQVFGREVVSGTGTTLWNAGPTAFTSDGWEIASAGIDAYNGDTDKWLSLVIEQPAGAGGVPSGLSLLGVGT